MVATVTFCHGIGEHIKRYDAVFTTFAEAGIAVHSFDQKGFGETGKKNGGLGHFISWQDLSSCIKEANKRIKTEGIPHFMMGHSMGGFEVLRFCAENPTEADGCIGSAPLVNVGEAVVIYSIQRFVVIQASYWLPWFSMPSPVDSIHLAKDPQVKKVFDPSNNYT